MLAYVYKVTAHNVAVIRLGDNILLTNKKWTKFSPQMEINKVKCFGSVAEAGKVCLAINKAIANKKQ